MPTTKLFDAKTLKKGQKILWLNRGEVEQGDVLFLTEKGVEVLWLEGYKSRNDTLTFDEILAVWAPNAPLHDFGCFTGRGWLTAAGEQYLAALPATH